MKNIDQAFTLVELIVVITILTILATIGFISLTGYSNEAKNTTNLTNLKTIDNALGYYAIKNEMYPEPDNFVNITSSGTIVALQGEVGNQFLGKIGVSQDTLDAISQQPYIYTKSIKTNTYGLLGYSNITSFLQNTTFAFTGNTIYKGNGAPIVLNEENKNITSDLDILSIPGTYTVSFDNENYGKDSNKLLKYYYHPNAISIVNFNDNDFSDILGNSTNTNKLPSITEGKIGNGMLINGDGGGLQVHINPDKFTDKLTISAWIKQKNYNLEDTQDRPDICGDNGIIMRFNKGGAYMVSDYQGTLCGYHYRYSPRGYHNSNYTIELETWTHIVQVWNGNDLKFYVNGQQVGPTINTQYSENYINTHGKTESYLIGIEAMDDNVGGLKRYFNGVIDEVSMYNTALTSEEIAELYSIAQ